MLIVQKYGGTSVANDECIMRAAGRITESFSKGNKLVVVLSAQGVLTDALIRKARRLNPNAGPREMDMLLSTGEQQSAALMAMAIHKLGFPAISLTAGQVGIQASTNYGNARIKNIATSRLNLELERNNIVLVAGFQGINRYGDITTLGRGASDTTAVAIAAKLNADLCEIYTDVDGVYTADPNIITNAIKLREISYEEMLELASAGTQVLHNRSVEMAKRYRVNLVVRSSMTAAEGTTVKEGVRLVEKLHVSGVAADDKIARISLVGVTDKPGMAFHIFSLLAKGNVPVDLILQPVSYNGIKDVTFTVNKADLQRSLDIMRANQPSIGYRDLTWAADVAKITIVGAGMASNPGVASMMFESLYDCGVNINMISTSEIKISVLVDRVHMEKALSAVHDKFIESQRDFFVKVVE
ncbi:MAG: aspartate kinase [Turicibacter sp.]|nr:aspartate kinase [Turicibacter sp.]